MQVSLSCNPKSDRYPRWGYLDRHAVSPHMAQAFLTATLIQAFACGIYMGWQRLTLERHVGLRQVTGFKPAVIPLPTPHPPPHVMHVPSFSAPVHQTMSNANLIPVDDLDAALVDADRFSAQAAGTGGGNGNGVDAPFENEIQPVFLEAPGVNPPQFVAFESAPELVTMQQPRYPEIAREAGVEGSVVVLVLVGDDGFVEIARLAGEGIPMLNPAALTAARTAVFKPALQADRPVHAWVAIPIQFDLRE